MDEYTSAMMRQINYQKLWEIWQTGKQGGDLSEEDARMYEIMEGHMQYAPLWDRLDRATEEQVTLNGVNLVLHVQFHHIVANQLADDNPPAVRQVLRVLMQKGMKEHDAVHAIASVVAWEVHDMMQKKRVFDTQRYIRALRQLPLRVKTPVKKKK